MTSSADLSYRYLTYIGAAPGQVWTALTDADMTARYWGHANVSDWQVGSGWEHRQVDGGRVDVTGEVLAVDPGHHLVITFDSPAEATVREPTVVTFLLEAFHELTRLTVIHEHLPDEQARFEVAHGWPAVLANLKTLLETGEPLPHPPWEMPPNAG